MHDAAPSIGTAGRVPSIAVLVPTCDRPRYLVECLRNLLDQTVRPARIVVIDDGSGTATGEVLRAFAGSIETIRTFGVGKPAALNVAMERVAEEYVWIFDDDDVPLLDALERLVAPLEAQRELGFSFCRFWYTPERPDGQLGTPVGASEIPDLERRGIFATLLEGNFIGGAALFARTACYREVGPFDPGLLRSQDYEMALRVVRRFSGVYIGGEPAFHYRQHAGMRGSRADRFPAAQRFSKWQGYDRIFFRDLHQTLPLDAYLLPGLDLPRHERLALLQRAAVMHRRDLCELAFADLDRVARHPDQSPLSERELWVVRWGLGAQPPYGGGLFRRASTPHRLIRLACRSPVLGEVTGLLARHWAWRCVSHALRRMRGAVALRQRVGRAAAGMR